MVREERVQERRREELAAVGRPRAALDGSRALAAQALVDLDAERRLRAVDRAEAAAIRAADLIALRRVEALARALVEPPSWYERPSFIIPTTAAVTLGVVLGVVYLVR